VVAVTVGAAEAIASFGTSKEGKRSPPACALSARTGEDRRNGEMLVLDEEQVSPFGRDRRALLLHA
jgi:hypothetical protein